MPGELGATWLSRMQKQDSSRHQQLWVSVSLSICFRKVTKQDARCRSLCQTWIGTFSRLGCAGEPDLAVDAWVSLLFLCLNPALSPSLPPNWVFSCHLVPVSSRKMIPWELMCLVVPGSVGDILQVSSVNTLWDPAQTGCTAMIRERKPKGNCIYKTPRWF